MDFYKRTTCYQRIGGRAYVCVGRNTSGRWLVTAESISFTVADTGEVQKVEMKDDITKVEISKTDISGKELPGARLTILDQEGNEVESWTSGEKPHYIEMLPIGSIRFMKRLHRTGIW